MGDDVRLAVLVLDGRATAQLMLAGELDPDAGPSLEQAVSELLRDPAVRRIEADAALVDFCDAGGLSVLLSARKLAAAHSVPFYLIEVREPLRKVLEASGLDQLFERPSE